MSVPQTVPVLQTYWQSNPVLVQCVYRILFTPAPYAFLFFFFGSAWVSLDWDTAVGWFPRA